MANLTALSVSHHPLAIAANRARVLDRVLEVLAPTRCAGCERYGPLWCDRCANDLTRGYDPTLACPRCAAPFGYLLCTECQHLDWDIVATVALGPLDGQLARAVVLHKDQNEQRLGGVLGLMLGQRVVLRWPDWRPDLVTWVPPTDRALARRGFDHGGSLARALASAVGAPCAPSLTRGDAADLRGLNLAERHRAAGTALRPIGSIGGRILLVDDVLTSGSTAAACAATLATAGAAEVRLAVVARAW